MLVWTGDKYWEPTSAVAPWDKKPVHTGWAHVYACPLSDGPEGGTGSETLKSTSKSSKHRCWCRMVLSSSWSTPSQRQMGKLKPMLREVPSPRPQAEMFALLVRPLFCCISLPFTRKSSLYDRELFIMLVLRDMISTFAVGWSVRLGLWAAVTFRETSLNPEVIQALW